MLDIREMQSQTTLRCASEHEDDRYQKTDGAPGWLS